MPSRSRGANPPAAFRILAIRSADVSPTSNTGRPASVRTPEPSTTRFPTSFGARRPSAPRSCVRQATAGPCSSSSAGPLGPRALRLAPGPQGRPQGVSAVDLARHGWFPQNHSTIEGSVYNTVVLGHQLRVQAEHGRRLQPAVPDAARRVPDSALGARARRGEVWQVLGADEVPGLTKQEENKSFTSVIGADKRIIPPSGLER